MTPDPIYKEIGELIRRRRKHLGLKQENLARELGISRGSLANIEIGRQSVLVHQLYRFATALKMSPIELLPPAKEPEMRLEDDHVPLPKNLRGEQKDQVAKFYVETEIKKPLSKEPRHAKSPRR